ncbi:TetR family transcriptional regulator [Rhodococcus sp. X156]|uniref:TetR/AcrR family transcriptional regulator n=1 Tax=Rhodococcus sp. X156 TaxID=2499145 RepID=UPI001F49480E|nr:TetR family transcriptional regulator [Rhodococcus sp. X156]
MREAALELIDTEGLAALSMRRLATELGVQAPSLYHHVAGKTELLDSLVEQVGAGADASWFGEHAWDEALLRWGRTYHAALAAHPALAPLFVSSPGSSDAALRRIDRVHGGLVAAGWTPREATEIAAAVKFLVMGAASGSIAAGFPADPELYAGRYPNLGNAHRLASHRSRVDADAVELALVALVDGLRLRLDQRRAAGSSQQPG